MELETTSLYQIEARLRVALDAPLPGTKSHLNLAPHPRHGWRPGYVPSEARTAAGLVLLYPSSNTPYILLTVRAVDLEKHPGQVSFPGGSIKDTETIPQAALREASEETGLCPEEVRVLGFLSSLHVAVSDFALHPVVGISDTRPTFNVQTNEVGRILEVPLSDLLNPNMLRRGEFWHRHEQIRVPYFELCEERVWGATAMILAELIEMIGRDLRNF